MKDSLNRQAEVLRNVSTNHRKVNGVDEELMALDKEFDDKLSIEKSGEITLTNNLRAKAAVVEAEAKAEGERKPRFSSLPRAEHEQRTEEESRDSDSCYRSRGAETRTSYSDSSLHDLLASLASLVGVNENDSAEVSNQKGDASNDLEEASGAAQETDEQTADFQWIYDTFADVFVPNDKSAFGDDKEETHLTTATTLESQKSSEDPSTAIESPQENNNVAHWSPYGVSHYLNSQHVGDSNGTDDGYLQVPPVDTSMYEGSWNLYSSLYTIVESANESSADDEGQSSSSSASRVASTVNSAGSGIGFEYTKNPSFVGYSHTSTDKHSQELTEQEILHSWEISLNQDDVGTDQIIEMNSYDQVGNTMMNEATTHFAIGYGAREECQYIEHFEADVPVVAVAPQYEGEEACGRSMQILGAAKGFYEMESESPLSDSEATPIAFHQPKSETLDDLYTKSKAK